MSKKPTFFQYLKLKKRASLTILVVFAVTLFILDIVGNKWLALIPLILAIISLYGQYKRDVKFKPPKK